MRRGRKGGEGVSERKEATKIRKRKKSREGGRVVVIHAREEQGRHRIREKKVEKQRRRVKSKLKKGSYMEDENPEKREGQGNRPLGNKGSGNAKPMRWQKRGRGRGRRRGEERRRRGEERKGRRRGGEGKGRSREGEGRGGGELPCICLCLSVSLASLVGVQHPHTR